MLALTPPWQLALQCWLLLVVCCFFPGVTRAFAPLPRVRLVEQCCHNVMMESIRHIPGNTIGYRSILQNQNSVLFSSPSNQDKVTTSSNDPSPQQQQQDRLTQLGYRRN